MRRLSEVVILASEDQAPCKVPPAAVTEMPLYEAAYISMVVELITIFVGSPAPSEICAVLIAPTDRVLPMFTKSRTESEEPNRMVEQTESLEPKRYPLRTDNVLPRAVQSKSDRLDATRATPQKMPILLLHTIALTMRSQGGRNPTLTR